MANIAPPSPPMIAARWHGGSQTPRAVVIHCTVSPCQPGGARATAHFFATEGNPTSAHYVVDPDETIQCVGDHTVAYHCGHNQDSIGIELCDPQAGPDSRWSDKNHTAMLDRASDLVARLCVVYGIDPARTSVADLKAHGARGIYGHNDSRLAFGQTTHTDPGTGFPWASFIKAVQAKAGALTMGKNAKTERVATANIPTKDTPKIKATPETARKALAEVCAKADLVCLQEFGIKPVLAGWEFTTHHPVVGWRTDRYTKHGELSVLLAKARNVEAEPGRRAHLPDVTATVVDLVELRSADRVAVSSTHFPAHVEVRGVYRRIKDHLTGRAAMHRQARRKWRLELERQAKMSDRVYGGADTNHDEPMPLRGFRSCWLGHPRKGTFGARTIDRIYAKRQAHEVQTVAIPSDHDAVVATYLI